MQSTSSSWSARLAKACVFAIALLFVLTLVRIAFFLAYRTPDTDVMGFLPALLMGLRVDAKWSALLLLPAWISLLLTFWKDAFWKFSVFCAGVAALIMTTLAVVNFGFYGFYATPISPIIFGFMQDDTSAILKTLWSDWPVLQYLGLLAVAVATPFYFARITPTKSRTARVSPLAFAAVTLLGTALLGLTIRGSVGTFPLRQQDFSVSPDAFINATVPGGAASLYGAYKAQKSLILKANPNEALTVMGFADVDEAKALLSAARPNPANATTIATGMKAVEPQPHIVLTIMESMGRDVFEMHKPPVNDTLGALADELQYALHFRNAISVATGTFVSLEGILFDTPIAPITQSRYGNRTFSFSRVLPYKKAGYKVVFLTSGPEAWRQIDAYFPIQGFDEIIGATKIKVRFPEAEVSTWGVGDEWMFKTAESLLADADTKGEKLFLVMLSTTNHPPFAVPDGVKVNPTTVALFPDWIQNKDGKTHPEMLKTYQYAANALGKFVRHVRLRDNTQRSTLIVATGDHNTRLHYPAAGVQHHAEGVPIMFWLPDALKKQASAIDTTRWVSHRDIFPTLNALMLGMTPTPEEGRNLFGDDSFDLANAFVGIAKEGHAIGRWGAVSLDGGSALTCYAWEGETLIPAECQGELKTMGDAARAQKALVDYKVRTQLQAAPQK